MGKPAGAAGAAGAAGGVWACTGALKTLHFQVRGGGRAAGGGGGNKGSGRACTGALQTSFQLGVGVRGDLPSKAWEGGRGKRGQRGSGREGGFWSP